MLKINDKGASDHCNMYIHKNISVKVKIFCAGITFNNMNRQNLYVYSICAIIDLHSVLF
jgi:hypothetical protein